MTRSTLLAALASALISGALARAQIPLTTAFTYQGEVRQSGVPAAGSVDLRFRLYDALTGGNQVGPQLQSLGVPLSSGRFTAELDFGPVFSGSSRWLEIDLRQAGGPAYTTLSPRQPLDVSPGAAFALSAGSATTATNATQLSGQPASFYQNASNLTAGAIPDGRLSGTYTGPLNFSNPANGLAGSFSGSFSGSGSSLTGVNAAQLGGLPPSSFLQEVPVPLTLSGSNSYILKASNSSNAAGSIGVSGESTGANDNTLGVSGLSTFGIGVGGFGYTEGGFFTSDTSNGDGVGARGWAKCAVGTTYGLDGWSESFDGTGVRGLARATSGSNFGVVGQTNSDAGIGVLGKALVPSGVTYAVRGQNASTAGTAVSGSATATTGITFGGSFDSASENGRGVYGRASATQGPAYGGYFQSSSSSGFGVYSLASAGTGFTYGVYGQNAAPAGAGVYGSATATTGSTYGGRFVSASPAGVGVSGWATASTGFGYGVSGQSDSPSGIAVYGRATHFNGINYGGWFQSDSLSGTGVYGLGNGIGGVGYGVHGVTVTSGNLSAGVLGDATNTSGQTYGVRGTSASTLAAAAGVDAVGNGVNSPGNPRAAALRIESGAITVAGSPKPADKITVSGFSCFSAWDDGPDCNNLAYGRAPIGGIADAFVSNPLIRADSLIYLTVKGSPPSPGVSCSAQVLSQSPGLAQVRVTVLGGATCQQCNYSGSVEVAYLIINPQ